jgi:hypothetical protein
MAVGFAGMFLAPYLFMKMRLAEIRRVESS